MKYVTNKAELEESLSGITLVKFGADWCGPCKHLLPIFDKLQQINKDVNFISVNIEFSQDLVSEFNINKIPIVLVFKNKELKKTIGGYNTYIFYQDIIDEYKK